MISNYIHILFGMQFLTRPNFNGGLVNSSRPSDAYMHQQANHHWFR